MERRARRPEPCRLWGATPAPPVGLGGARRSLNVLGGQIAGHATEPRSRVGRRADVVKAADDGLVVAAARKRPPEMKLAERAGTRIGIAADQVYVVALEIRWREHGGLHRCPFEVDDVATEPRQYAPGICGGELRCPGAIRRHGDLIRRGGARPSAAAPRTTRDSSSS